MSEVVQEGDALQVALWQRFYERAWKLRAEYMEGLIAQGEQDPFRIIGLLEQRQRFQQVSMTEGVCYWKDMQYSGELLPTGVPVLKASSFRGGAMGIPYYVVHQLHLLVLDYALRRGPFDCIIELGCGYGQNLFRIFAQGGPNIPYYGGEFTDSGVAMAHKLAALVPERDYQFFHFNHLKPDMSVFPRHKRALVFTCHSIEQVLDVPKAWFDAVAGYAEDVHCIHMEPFGFQVQNLGALSLESAEFFRNSGWNRNLAPAAVEAASRGSIYLENMICEMGYTDHPANMTSFMFWQNRAPQQAG